EERTEGDAVEHPLAIHPHHWLARTRAVAARTPGEGERLHRASRCTPRLAGHHQDPAGLDVPALRQAEAEIPHRRPDGTVEVGARGPQGRRRMEAPPPVRSERR